MALTFRSFTTALGSWLGGRAGELHQGAMSTGPVPGPVAAPIDESSALSVSALWACVKILTETIAGLPLGILRKDPGGQWLATDHDVMHLLTVQPNQRMGAMAFWEAVAFNLVYHGNAYIHTPRIGSRVVGLYPLPKTQVQKELMPGGEVAYLFWFDGKWVEFASSEILHIHGPGNGLIGLSPFDHARSTAALAKGADQYASDFFRMGGTGGGVLELDKLLTKEQRTALAERMTSQDASQGAHRVRILEAGMKYQRTQLTPTEMQVLEARKHSVSEIARFFGVNTALINGDVGTQLGSSVEQIFLGFYSQTIAPYSRRICSALLVALLTPAEAREYRFAHDFDALMIGDMKAKAEYYTRLVAGGLMTPNEARKRLGLPRSTDPNADALVMQSGMTTVANIGLAAPSPTPGLPAPGPTIPAEGKSLPELRLEI